MDSPGSQSQGGDVENPSQRQARLRRERREAKIKEGGTSRLEKITNISGRQNIPGMLRIPRPTTLSALALPMKLELNPSQNQPT